MSGQEPGGRTAIVVGCLGLVYTLLVLALLVGAVVYVWTRI